MGTIRFELRKDKLNAKKMAPISLIYQVSGDRVRIPTNQFVYPCNWDIKQQKVINIPKDKCSFNIGTESYSVPKNLILDSVAVRTINKELETIAGKIEDIETVFIKTNVTYTAEKVKDAFTDQSVGGHRKSEEKGLLYKFIDEYIELSKGRKRPGSIKVYKTTQNHLRDFEKAKKVNVKLESIDSIFFLKFQNFLNFDPTKNLSNTTVAKALKTLKTIINFARTEKGTLMPNYKGFKVSKEELPVIALNAEEFEKVVNLDLSNKPSLDRVRDVYIFSSVTGLRFSDLQQLEWDHIQDDAIDLTQMKTATPVFIPLNNIASAILSKYAGMAKPLPMISNQKSNAYIKEVGKLAGVLAPVEKIKFRGSERTSEMHAKYLLMSMHQGRRNFITFCLQRGMAEREVMRFSGHKDFKSVSRYVSSTREHQRSLMKKIWDNEDRQITPKLRIV
jgi:integrase